jgi:hypothetical protein
MSPEETKESKEVSARHVDAELDVHFVAAAGVCAER